MMRMLTGCFVLLLGTVVLILVTAALITRMRDSRHGTSGAMSSAMLEVQALLEPDKRHTIEQVKGTKREERSVPGDLPSP
jgi:hypothetical protein